MKTRMSLRNDDGKWEFAYVFMYRKENGLVKIPNGYVIHHTCFNGYCLNTDHMIMIKRSAHARIHFRASNSIRVAQIHPLHGLIKIWESMIDAERDGKFDHSKIAKCCNGTNETHYGCWWMKMGGINHDEI